MSTVDFQLAYDGEDVRGHSMDVQELAPALLALGNLIRDANTQLNGENSKVRVLVQSDFEHKCFNVHFEVVQSILSQLSDMLGDHRIHNAKELLEWLGLIGVLPAGGLIGFLRWRGKKEIESSTTLHDRGHGGEIHITATDGSSVTINQNIYHLAQNPKIKQDVAGVFAPLRSPGIESVTFRSDATDLPDVAMLTYGKVEAEQIIAATETVDPDKVLIGPQRITTHLRVHSPVFDPKAERWRFKFGEEIIYADITETTIARDAVQRGVVSKNDTYRVVLEITEHETPQGQFRNVYKVIEVLDFIAAPQQQQLFK